MRLNINQFQTRGAKIYVQVNSKQNHNLQNIGDCQLYIFHKNCYMYHSQNAHCDYSWHTTWLPIDGGNSSKKKFYRKLPIKDTASQIIMTATYMTRKQVSIVLLLFYFLSVYIFIFCILNTWSSLTYLFPHAGFNSVGDSNRRTAAEWV